MAPRGEQRLRSREPGAVTDQQSDIVVETGREAYDIAAHDVPAIAHMLEVASESGSHTYTLLRPYEPEHLYTALRGADLEQASTTAYDRWVDKQEVGPGEHQFGTEAWLDVVEANARLQAFHETTAWRSYRDARREQLVSQLPPESLVSRALQDDGLGL